MTFGQRFIGLSKTKKLSQGDISKKVGTSDDIICRYERDEVTPSLKVASKLVNVLDVSLDYPSGKADTELDSATLGRIREISVMLEDDKKQVFLVLDSLIWDYKASKTYVQ